MQRPPCWHEGKPCPNICADHHYQRTIYNITPLHGPWSGWRMAGAELIDPTGARIRPERLQGLIWRQDAEARRDRAQARREAKTKQQLVKVVTVELDEYRRHFGSSAG